MDPDAVASGTPTTGSREAAKDKETVKVVVRCRPFSSKELNENRKSIITIDTQSGAVGIRCPDNDQLKSFTFDSAYDETTTQRQFYDESGYPLVESIFEGYNGTIFAYGQTGCGKTHTMQGRDNPPELRGVIPHSFDHIFENIQADPQKEYMVRASYLEIYNEEIRDLLADDQKKKLELKEGVDGSVYVKDLIEVVVSDVDSINRVMAKGFKNRTVGATLMNEGSSRSHSIFTVVVEVSEKISGQEHFKAGKLNLVDLAGSERQSKTGATGNRLKEGCKINLSLSALGNVISALVDGKGKHIPYRDSKLTRLLQDSLGGNTKTLMVAAISPADYNYDETLSTLRYANRAKNIKNKPIVNEDPKDAKLREYKEEIERLRKLLETQSRGGGLGTLSGVSTPTRPLSAVEPVAPSPSTSENDAQLAREREEIAKYQQEAAEMMARAKRMMDEARVLQEEKSKIEEEKAKQATVVVAERETPSAEISGVTSKPSSANRPTALPPLNPVSPRESKAQPQPPPQPSPRASEPPPPAKPQPPVQSEPDPSIEKALREAAKVDAQAKAMMAKAEQLINEAERRAKEPPKVKIVKEVVVKEVIPDAHVTEQAALKERAQIILDERDEIGRELERTQQVMESHLREKEELNNKLRKIESQILGGGGSSRSIGTGKPLVDSEIALLKQQVEYRRAQIKLKEKAKREAQFEAAQKALTLEKQLIEEELKNAQEIAQAHLAAARKKESKFRAKLEAARQEVVDLNNEFERERENLLDTIREQTKESKLLEQLVELFLPQNELVKVWERAVWAEDKEEWQLPKIKPRSDFQKIKLPALGMGSPTNTIESGGAEVDSDDELGTGTSTARSIGSSNGLKRPKQSKAKPSEVSPKSVRPEEPTLSSRVKTPASNRLPSAVRPVKEELQPQAEPPSSSKSSPHSSKEPRRRSSREASREGYTQLPPNSVTPASYLPDRMFSDDDLLAPLNPDGYQPRDRLQSRQGSRQGPRSMDRSGIHSNTSSQTSLGEFDAPPTLHTEKPPIASRGSHSRSSGSTRKHRKERVTSDMEQTPGSEETMEMTSEYSPDSSLIKKRSKHKKKRDRKERAASTPEDGVDGSPDRPHHDDNDLLNELGTGFFLPRTRTTHSPEEE
ncbi:hypothetical protein Poli38472_011661 [Pythium oligandrum]|uniref:Kinesin motor domain-containing protein n=1 Tax=Pythium oligandrum TaxID=41045 RepID=A0A8K1CL97_PYTOL|nr:hypothetical protein Poli38472_011661 [Pythium oligandrum]|eukprot:TMW64781.1 hypothetical protein Poli38472_011661 [Pythium oligandrum]